MHRRRFLILCVSVISVLGIVGISIPFIGSLGPSAGRSRVGEIDLSEIPLGSSLRFDINGFPAVLYKPDSKMVDYLISLNEVANGPDFSKENIPQFFIYVPISTHFGCLLEETKAEDEPIYGYKGYWDPCHRGFWDHSGRLIPEAHAGEGLEDLQPVTNYMYISKSVFRIESASI